MDKHDQTCSSNVVKHGFTLDVCIVDDHVQTWRNMEKWLKMVFKYCQIVKET